jgi:type III secretion system-like peptide-binding chaperone
MVEAAAATWDDVVDELAARLPRLRDGDAVAIEVGERFVQVKQFGQVLSAIASGVDPKLREHVRVSAEQSRHMLALGWRLPDEMTHSLPDLPRPVSAETAGRVARLLVATLRDVYGAATPADAVVESHNDAGHRAPTLRTVATSPDQEPEVRVEPATLLPAPDPTWRSHLRALLDGVGGWSRAEIEAVLGRCGAEITDERLMWVTATGGGVEMTAFRGDGHGSGPDFGSVRVRESLPMAAAGPRFREVLAAAVAVLGDPPLVGGPGAYARWRGDPLTVIVSRRPPLGRRRDTAAVELTVTPTDVIETEEYRSGTYDPAWRPEHRWTTDPDTDAPEHRTLGGMTAFPHPPAADLAELGDNLRELLGSLTADLPLLHPYASSACLRVLHRSSGEWLADCAITADRARVRVGGSSAPLESVPLDGSRTGAEIAGRIMDAVAAAGVEALDRLSVLVWSATPAERLRAEGLPRPPRG